MDAWMPCLVRVGEAPPSLRHPLLDDYLRFVKARVRPNSLLAVAFDLKVFFEVIRRDPLEVTTRDVLAFVEAQRQPRLASNVIRIDDGEQGLSARTVKRRLSSVSGLFAFLVARGDVDSSPVPRELATPLKIAPDVQVSRTLIALSPGNPGSSAAQIHLARTSLVGFSSQGISLR